jgi:hypothetical protein
VDHIAPAPSDTAETFDGVIISKGASREDGLVALRGREEE